MMDFIAVMGRFEFDHANIEAATRAAAEMAQATRLEPGCISYTFGTDIERPACLVLSELWRDATALEEHFDTPHMAVFRNKLRNLKMVKMDASRLTVSSIHDMFADRASTQTSTVSG